MVHLRVLYLPGDQLNMEPCTVTCPMHASLQWYTCTLDKSLFTGYQKHTVMFNWSLCIVKKNAGS